MVSWWGSPPVGPGSFPLQAANGTDSRNLLAFSIFLYFVFLRIFITICPEEVLFWLYLTGYIIYLAIYSNLDFGYNQWKQKCSPTSYSKHPGFNVMNFSFSLPSYDQVFIHYIIPLNYTWSLW